jgi:ubiquinone biosynthesis protein
MIEGFKKMGFIGDDPAIDKMCKKIIRILGDFLINEMKLDSINITQVNIDDIDISKLLRLIKGLDIKEIEEVVKIPKDWVLLNRTIVLIMGLTTELAPETEIYKEVKPNILKMAIQKENLGMVLNSTIKQQALRLISLPRKIELFLAQAENGELEINVKTRKIEIKLIYALVQQVLFLIVAVFCYLMYSDTGNDPENKVLKWVSLGSALLFIRSFLLGFYYKRKLK